MLQQRDSVEPKPPSYLAFGRRGLLKAVFDVDKRLSEISDSFDFLLHVAPVDVDAAWRAFAEEILGCVPPGKRGESKSGHLNAEEFARRARAELEHYRQIDPEFSSSVDIRDDVFSVMVSHGDVLIGKNTTVPKSRVNALLQHEVGTHILTYFNGRSQPLRILYNGLAGYDGLPEGSAVLAEHLVGELTPNRLRILAARVIVSRNLIDGASFVETYRELCSKYRFERERAFHITMRIYRGDGLTTNAVYLRGLVGILDYLKNDEPLDPLLLGKIASPYFSISHELQMRGVLIPPRLRPRYLEFPESRDRLEKVRKGISPLDLID